MTVTEEAAGPRLRGELSSRATTAEVGILLYRGCQSAMVHGLTDMLTTASDFSVARGGRALRLSHWSPDEAGTFGRSFNSSPGAEGFADILVAPGRLSGPVTAEEAVPFARWLIMQHARGAVLASNCGGAFLLAETGLLRGRSATTHWMFADLLQTRFPEVIVEPEKIVIDDGDIITAGGLMAWTDLGMRLIDRLLGPSIMVETSRFFLVDARGREQRHYASFAPRLTHGDEAILKVQHWLQVKGARAISVADMARSGPRGPHVPAPFQGRGYWRQADRICPMRANGKSARAAAVHQAHGRSNRLVRGIRGCRRIPPCLRSFGRLVAW